MVNKFGEWIHKRITWRWTIRPQLKQQLLNLDMNLPTVFYIGMPEHGDLGDHAVAYATELFLRTNLPEHQIVKGNNVNTLEWFLDSPARGRSYPKV